MSHASASTKPMRAAHQSTAPWLTTLAADEVLHLQGVTARRWLLVQRGRLWVTAATALPGPAAREADIWLAEGDSLSLPAGSSWLLQAGPQVEWMLLEQPVQPKPPDRLKLKMLGRWFSRFPRMLVVSGQPA